MKVLKFGGTSLANSQMFNKVLQICISEKPKIIVVSAVAGITNELIQFAESLNEKNIEAAQKTLSKISNVFVNIIAEGFDDIKYIELCQLKLAERISLLTNQISNKKVNEHLIVAQGEFITSELLQIYFSSKGRKLKLLPANALIYLDQEGNPDLNKTNENVSYQIDRKNDIVYLTQGFICSDFTGNTATLGRGGSDLSASIIGAAINATEIQIWTDINGLHNNDPRFVNNTKAIRSLSFNEAAELAYFGAKILHPVCILPAKEKNIPVLLKNTLDAEDKGTIISANSGTIGIKAIAAKDNILIIKIKSARMLMSYGFLKRIFETFDAHKIPVDVITTSEVAVSLTIDYQGDITPLMKELMNLGEVELLKDQVIICIVGEGLVADSNNIQKILISISDIPLQMVSIGGSKINVTIVTDAIYKTLILNELQTRLMNAEYVTSA